MQLPAIRAKSGQNWTYYITKLTFQQVSDYVEKIDEELHKSETLRDLIQRSITNNVYSIKDYVLNQPELFFNSLVLAVYDDYPIWREVRIDFGGEEHYELGFLEFPGKHKIFPVDGQHRVEGIKEAIQENPEVGNNEIGVIFIGHKNDERGKQKTRRLFTTLNRYAKPVSLDDIIALDEDDVVAINTRYLLEEYSLFSGSRTIKVKQKGIPETNKTAITSIITLYQCNLEIFKAFYRMKFNEKPTKSKIDNYLRFRPEERLINEFISFCLQFWDDMVNNFSVLRDYINIPEEKEPAQNYRDKKRGGNLLFRPVGLLPFIKAVIEINFRSNKGVNNIIEAMSKYNFTIDKEPWLKVIWDPNSKTMIMGSSELTKLIFIYAYDEMLLRDNELQKLKEKYATKIGYEGNNLEEAIKEIPKLA